MASLAVIATVIAIAVPGWREVNDRARVRQAAADLAGRLRHARHLAVATGRAAGVLFALRDGEWTVRTCVDGAGDGLRPADVHARLDPCLDEAAEVSRIWPGARLAVEASIPGPDATPPGSDPVRFGPAGIATFTPPGTATPGTVFLRSPGGGQFAVRVAGATGRTRLLRYDPARRAWLPD